MFKNIKYKQGISIAEVIVASAIITLFMLSIANVYSNFQKLSIENTYKTQAVFLLDEGVESLRMMRSYAWSDIASSTSNTDYYLIWQSTTTPTMIDDLFIRKYTVNDVYRDPETLNIVYSGGVSDINTKIIKMKVEWNYKNILNTKETSFYLINIYE